MSLLFSRAYAVGMLDRESRFTASATALTVRSTRFSCISIFVAKQSRFAERKAMIDREHDLPITKQAAALNMSRGSVCYLPWPVSAADLTLMRRIDELHLEFPFAGSRLLRDLLAAEGSKIGGRHVTTLMKRMGIEALYRRPRT